jgi:hypothetical protein
VNTFVGLLLVIVGVIVILSGVAMVVAQIIGGAHGKQERLATTMAGFNWKGLEGVLNALAAIFKALKDWPPPALVMLLGLAGVGMGLWVLAAKPIS